VRLTIGVQGVFEHDKKLERNKKRFDNLCAPDQTYDRNVRNLTNINKKY